MMGEFAAAVPTAQPRGLGGLVAAGPNPEHADRLMLFGKFVGSWELDGVAFDEDGARTEYFGEWVFGWLLEGRAVHDVAIEPESGARFYSVRFYDPAVDAWHVTSWHLNWATPLVRAVRAVSARGQADGGIVLEGAVVDTQRQLRWSFSPLTDQGFTWEGRSSTDGGRTWHLDEVIDAHRAGGS
jgi:hypothetical protein